MTTLNGTMDAATLNSLDGVEQHLTFIVDKEEYGVDILRVQGIQGWDTVTPIPNTPDYILGVINLRGSVVPIFDLRRRFGLSEIPFGPTTVVIVVRVECAGGEKIVGIVVDAVSEVYLIDEREIKTPPDFGAAIDTRFVRGLASVEEKMVILLDIDQLLGTEDALTEAGPESADDERKDETQAA